MAAMQPGTVVDARAVDALRDSAAELIQTWDLVQKVSHGDPPPCGLAAGERPAADVEVLASTAAAVEFELARRMHTAREAGCLPLHDPGALLAARGWSLGAARRLARAGGLASQHPNLAAAWAAGLITAEHVDPIARTAERFTAEELAAVIGELGPHWGSWSPAAIGKFVTAADRMLHPPPDPTGDEADAYESRSLSFAVTADTVLVAAELPRIEGELVIAAIDALAERLRSTADHVPAAARRADALVELVNTAATAGALPSRGGLPVAVTVTVAHTALGDPVVSTSRGHLLTDAETRWACCDAMLTPILVDPTACVADPAEAGAAYSSAPQGSRAQGNAAQGNAAQGGMAYDGTVTGGTVTGGAVTGGAETDRGSGRESHPPAYPDPGSGSGWPVPSDVEADGVAGRTPADTWGVAMGKAQCAGDGSSGLGEGTECARPDSPIPTSTGIDPPTSPAARVAALAALMFDTRIPLAVGRTSRTATPGQRRALAVRDRGCVIPGCQVPAEACQAHHLTDWAQGGETNIEGLTLLCWSHHRQVDLKMWALTPTTDPPPVPSDHSMGVPWPANHGAPFQITRTPRVAWRVWRN